MQKKFSIGLSLDITLEEYEKIFEKYKDYIHSIYFSPPLGKAFQSRGKITTQFQDPKKVDLFYKVLELARKKGIKLDCVLNRPSLKLTDLEENIEVIKNINPDQITCLERHIDYIDEQFPNIEKIYSYNNEFRMNKLDTISPKFKTIVVGKGFIRNIGNLELIAQKGYKLKPLINNGCSYNCSGCRRGNEHCKEVFERNKENHTVEELYALQSFFPSEFDIFLSKIKHLPIESIKISNRTDGYEYLDKCLDAYINGRTKEYIEENKRNYRLFGRTAVFNPYLNNLDYEEIEKEKEKIKCMKF